MQNRSDTRLKIELLAIMAMFGLLGPIVRAIGFPSAVTAGIREAIAALALIVYALLKKHGFDWKGIRANLAPMLLGSVFMSLDHIFFFRAYEYTTVAVTTLCYYIAPTIVVVVSALFLKERFSVKQWICACVAFLGMVLVSGVIGGWPQTGSPKGVFFALLAALFYAAIIIINKMYPYEDFLVRTMIQLAGAAVITVVYAAAAGDFEGVELTARPVLLLLLLGIGFTAFPYIIYFRNVPLIPASTVAIFSYADPIVAVLVSALALGEPMTALVMTGAVLIIGSAIVSET